MLESLRNKKIMVVVAHPDDELLGLGGTLNKLVSEFNCRIHVVILGEGITSRSDQNNPEGWTKELQIHRANVEAAQASIGYQSLSLCSLPDNRFDQVDLLDIIKLVEKEKADFHPEVVFTHHGSDLNIDHRRTFEAVVTATRPIENEPVQTLITFETPSGTEWQASSNPQPFNPNFFVELSEANLQSKIKGMECYEFEKRKYPHPRSPEALRLLAQYRGMIVGKNLAEAFQLIRCIDG
ncbi:MAG: PIG-L family deacetylase [Cyclobacteriaceae bacterium]